MAYKNAKDILPDELIAEIQKYTDGELIYIPSSPSHKSGWGEKSGAKHEYELRNNEIKHQYGMAKTVKNWRICSAFR